MRIRMIAVVGTALSVLVLGFPSEALPQDSVPAPIPASVAVAAEIPQALVQGEIVDASGAPGSRTLTYYRPSTEPEDFVNGGNSVRQCDPGEGIPVSQRTGEYLSYDGKERGKQTCLVAGELFPASAVQNVVGNQTQGD